MEGCRVAVIGATGAVGKVFLRIVEERKFPYNALRVCATERSWGKRILVNGREHIVEPATPELFGQVDIAFISASGKASREYGPIAVQQGALVIDDSSTFRMDPHVPLVVPEVNADDLEGHRGIISIPNCSTTPLVMVLKPLNDLNPVRRVVVDTYQSVSGKGSKAVAELLEQTRQLQEGRPAVATDLPQRIAYNLFPHIDTFEDTGYTKEEMKMVGETRKILHLPDLPLSATCVRVPVLVGHSEAVHIEFERPMEAATVREALSESIGIRVVDNPASALYPMPIEAEGIDDVLVGRIRKDLSHPNGIALWLSSDNLRKGAALNAIQIAEEVLKRGLLLRQRKAQAWRR